MKFVNSEINFAEVPDEAALCINISNCPCHCVGCHSSHLAEDIGKTLDEQALDALIAINSLASCVAFMGGDASPDVVNRLARHIKEKHKDLSVAWYSGRDYISDKISLENFDFIKIGPYIEKYGPLNSKTTNQKFYKIVADEKSNCGYSLKDITYMFWK